MKTYEKQIEDYYSSWESFTKSSGDIDKEAFISLMTRAKRLAAAGSKIENPNPFESIVMSILVEHQRELSKLVDQLLTVKTKTCPRCNRTSSVEDFYKGNGIDDSISILCQRCQEALFFRKIENR